MVILPKVRCPGCGKLMAEARAKEVPPAVKLSDCLRRCPRCNIGATNAKNPLKVKFIFPPPKAQGAPGKSAAESAPAPAPESKPEEPPTQP